MSLQGGPKSRVSSQPAPAAGARVILDASAAVYTQGQPRSRARFSRGAGATEPAYPTGFVAGANVLMLLPSGKWEPGIIQSIELQRYYESWRTYDVGPDELQDAFVVAVLEDGHHNVMSWNGQNYDPLPACLLRSRLRLEEGDTHSFGSALPGNERRRAGFMRRKVVNVKGSDTLPTIYLSCKTDAEGAHIASVEVAGGSQGASSSSGMYMVCMVMSHHPSYM